VKGTWQTTDSGSGGTLLIAVIVVIVMATAASAGAAIHAAAHELAELLRIVFIVAGVLTGLTVAGIAGLWLHVRRTPRRPSWAAQVVQSPATAPQRAVEAPAAAQRVLPPRQVHVHFHGVDPSEVAAIIQQQSNLEEN
jgi:hypothetical protein